MKIHIWSGNMFGQKRIKALEERVHDLEEKLKLLFDFKEQTKSADAQEDGKELSTKEILDEWLNGGKNAK